MQESNQARAAKLLKSRRKQIDVIDNQILKLLARRFGVVRKVAKIKEKNGIPAYLSDRVVQVRERCANMGKSYGIDPELIRFIYSAIIYKSCSLEDDLMKKPTRKKK